VTVNNLRKYKLSKILVRDLAVLVEFFDQAEAGLKPYIRYKPVAKVVREMRAGRVVLEAHLEEARQVVKAKGVEVGQ
jgi:hypothetical protein